MGNQESNNTSIRSMDVAERRLQRAAARVEGLDSGRIPHGNMPAAAAQLQEAKTEVQRLRQGAPATVESLEVEIAQARRDLERIRVTATTEQIRQAEDRITALVGKLFSLPELRVPRGVVCRVGKDKS